MGIGLGELTLILVVFGAIGVIFAKLRRRANRPKTH